MPSPRIVIAPRRSAALFAFLAIGLVVFTYALILLIAAACVYLPYLLLVAMHTLHAQVVILLLGGLVIAGTILFSIVPRREKFVAPGLLLEPSAHPLLFDEIERIAADLNEPVPREVYLVGNVNAFVTDRGGLLGIGSRRVMGIGLPLFSILNVSELRGVLAHEFAHYYAGDTRLGPWTYKTQCSVARTFRNIGSIGESVSLPGLFRVMQSVVSNILAYYFLFFLRVINFISRKAEFRADELACLVAGSSPVLHGLRAIHGAALAWPPTGIPKSPRFSTPAPFRLSRRASRLSSPRRISPFKSTRASKRKSPRAKPSPTTAIRPSKIVLRPWER